MGDFNAVAKANRAYTTLTSEGAFHDSFEVAKEKVNAGWNTFNGFGQTQRGNRRIDWVLTRGPVLVDRTEIVLFKDFPKSPVTINPSPPAYACSSSGKFDGDGHSTQLSQEQERQPKVSTPGRQVEGVNLRFVTEDILADQVHGGAAGLFDGQLGPARGGHHAGDRAGLDAVVKHLVRKLRQRSRIVFPLDHESVAVLLTFADLIFKGA